MNPLGPAGGPAPVRPGEDPSLPGRKVTAAPPRAGGTLRLDLRLAGTAGEDLVLEGSGRRLLLAGEGEVVSALRRAATVGRSRLVLLLPRGGEPGERAVAARLVALDGEPLDLAVSLRRAPATETATRPSPGNPAAGADRPEAAADLRRPFAATVLATGRASGRLTVVLEPVPRPPATPAAPPAATPSAGLPPAGGAAAGPSAVPAPTPVFPPPEGASAPPATAWTAAGASAGEGARAAPPPARPAPTPSPVAPPPSAARIPAPGPLPNAPAAGATAPPSAAVPPPAASTAGGVAAGTFPASSGAGGATPATAVAHPPSSVAASGAAGPTPVAVAETAGSSPTGPGTLRSAPPGTEVLPRLEAGSRVDATVIGRDPAGRLVLRLADGPAAPLLQIEEPGLDVPPGSRLTVRVDRVLEGGAREAAERAPAAVPATGPATTATIAMTDRDAALRLFAYLLRRPPAEAGDRATAAPTRAETPAPAAAPGSGGGSGANAVVWLTGGEAPRALRIGEEAEGKAAADEDGGRRWIFALELAAFGAVRLELWSRGGSRQLAVRSERPLSEEVRRLIADMFGAALEITGSRGWLVFTDLVAVGAAGHGAGGRGLIA